MTSNNKLSEKVFKNLPHRQRLIIGYGLKLAPLVERYAGVGLAVHDQGLTKNLGGILEKIGFNVLMSKKLNAIDILKNLIAWKARGSLTIMQHRTDQKPGAIVNLFRSLKEMAPFFTYENVIPIFFGAPGLKKQHELFKSLGKFGIKYACFLTPGISTDQNIEELLEHLVHFSRLDNSGDATTLATKVDESRKEVESIEEYKRLLEVGEKLMREKLFEEAVEQFSKAIDMKPDFTALINRGDAYYWLKQFGAALQDYYSAHKMELSTPSPYAKIGACCFMLTKKFSGNGCSDQAKKWLAKGMDAIKKAEDLVLKMEREPLPENRACNPYADIVNALVQADFRGMGLQAADEKLSGLTCWVLDRVSNLKSVKEEMGLGEKLAMATLMVRNKKFEQSDHIIRDVLEKDAQRAAASLNNIAVELGKNCEFTRAMEIYAVLLGFDNVGGREVILLNLVKAARACASSHMESGDANEAIKVFEAALAHVPNHEGREWALLEYATLFLENQDQSSASARLVEAMYINPGLFSNKRFEENYSDLASLKNEIIKKLTKGAL